ncbi:MAG: hypothetical protein ACKV19_17000 [Verrucomicrobiales bacterium]
MSPALAHPSGFQLLHRPGFWIALLAALPLLVGGLYVSVNWIGSCQLKSVVDRLKSNGFDISLAPPAPSGAADVDNFCATPLMRGIAEGKAHGPAWEGVDRLQKWHRAAVAQGIRPRSLAHPKVTDWAALYAVLRESSPLSQLDEVDPDPAAFVRIWLDGELESVTTELRSVLGRPHAHFVPGYWESAVRSPVLEGPALDFLAMYRLGLAYRYRAESAMAHRDAATFLESIRILGRLADACRTEAPVLGVVVGSSTLNFALEATWFAAADQTFTPDDWRRLGDFWRHQRPLDSLEDGVRTELAFGYLSHAQLRVKPAEYLGMVLTSDPFGGLSEWEERVARLIPPGWFDAAHASWVTEAQALVHRIRDPAIPDRYNLDDWLDQRVGDARFPSPRVSVRSLSVLVQPVRRIAAVHATARLAEAACALEAHAAENESPPDTLEALVPRYLTTVPLDLDGRPIRYSPVSATGRYKLWSIGSDGVDNGGAAKGGSQAWINTTGDWVWEYPL